MPTSNIRPQVLRGTRLMRVSRVVSISRPRSTSHPAAFKWDVKRSLWTSRPWSMFVMLLSILNPANLMAAVGGTYRRLLERQETEGTWSAHFLSRYVFVFYVLESYSHCCSLRWHFRSSIPTCSRWRYVALPFFAPATSSGFLFC